MPLNSAPFSQTEFAQNLFDAEAIAPDGVVDPNGNPAPKRFSVYKNNVVVSYLDALESAYPACKNLVGEEFFKAVGRAYLKESPPSSQLMILFGDGFADFVQSYEYAQQIPFLPDVARIERAWRIAYHSEDIHPITPEQVGAFPAEQLGDATIEFLPSVDLVQSKFAAFSLWNAALNMQPLDGIEPHQAQTSLIVRPGYDVMVGEVAALFAAPLKLLLQGATLNEAAAAGTETSDEFDFSAFFGFLMQTGSMADIKINNEGTE